MDTLFRIAAMALVASLFATLIKKTSPDMAMLLVIAVCAVVLATLGKGAQALTKDVQMLANSVGIDITAFTPLIKTVAISIVSKTSADLCRDAGESAVGGAVEMAGAFASILCAMPLLNTVWNTLSELL